LHAVQQLIEGYRRFRAQQWPERRAVFEALADEGQSPRTMVIACSDSRVDPTMIFSAQPGELFILRNVANLVPPYAPDSAYHATSAALEFAVRVLRVHDVIVMGHAMCGGVKVLMEGAPASGGDFLVPWMHIADQAKQRVMHLPPAERLAACENETVKVSLDHLMTFPWIADRVGMGVLRLTGMSFDIRSGILTMLRPDGTFAPV
jgi:carbonic anhydrase